MIDSVREATRRSRFGKWAVAAIRCATLQARVRAARSRWYRCSLGLLRLGPEGIRFADAMVGREFSGQEGALSDSAALRPAPRGEGHAAGGASISTGKLIALPASCPSRPLRDGRRSAHGNGPVVSLPPPSIAGRKGNSVMWNHPIGERRGSGRAACFERAPARQEHRPPGLVSFTGTEVSVLVQFESFYPA